MALVEPHAEVDEAAGERAEGPVRIAVPGDLGAAMRTARPPSLRGFLACHGVIVSAGLRAVNVGRRLTSDRMNGVASLLAV